MGRNQLAAVVAVCALMIGACADSQEPASAPVDDSSSSAASSTTSTISALTDTATTESPDTGGVRTADVERLEDGRLRLTWERSEPGPVDISWGIDPDAPDTPLETVAADELVIDDPSEDGRAYFRISTSAGAVTVAERQIPLEGHANFRDLGGYETEDGRRVRWGRLYRSGELGELTDADIAHLTDVLGIRLVCDLRSPGEVAELADPVLDGADQIEIPIHDTSVDPVALEEAIIAGDLSVVDPQLLVNGNRSFVSDFTTEYAMLLDRVMDPNSWPTNLHCTAGKDRAGWGSALILLALGVPEETVMEDYLLSATYRAEENEATIEQVRSVVAAVRGIPPTELPDEELDGLRALLDVRPEFLGAAFDQIRAEYGDVATYLSEGLGVTTDELADFRDAMLE